MRSSVYQTLIEPIDSQRYNSTKKIAGVDFTVHTSISDKDWRHVNKIGIVTGLPLVDVKFNIGDEVLVHHNVFRQFWNNKGKLQNSNSSLGNDNYSAWYDQIFAFRAPGQEWTMIDDNILVLPVKNDTDFTEATFKPLHGTLAVGNTNTSKLGLKPGEHILFTPNSEHKYELDDILHYRMRTKDIAYYER